MGSTPLNFRALYSLVKPGVALAVLATVVPGLFLGPLPSGFVIAMTMLGTALSAMASFTYNQIIEASKDARMERTKIRVIPSGAMAPATVFIVGSTALGAGLLILYIYVNLLTAGVAFFSFLFYVFVYTVLLKPNTEHNTVIGGIAGATGPLIGQAASLDFINIEGVMLFLLIFLWTPPHFWALAIHLKDDYARAGFPMLPVTRGIDYTVRQMIAYQILLLIGIAAVYWPLGSAGLLYLLPSLAAGLFVLGMIFVYAKNRSATLPRKIFLTSILHLVVWHVAMTADLYLSRHA